MSFPDTILPAIKGDALELDELVIRFVFKRRYRYRRYRYRRYRYRRWQHRWFAPWQHRPCDKGSGKISIVEGLNNKWRNRVPGLVRKTVCVRYIADLQKRLWLVIQGHNQLRITQVQRMLKSTP